MSCPYEVNDGAYVLGALAPAERAEFEDHLATCPSCRESVAMVAVLPGLLGRLTPESLEPSVSASSDLLPRVIAAARARRREQRRRQLLTTAAACVAAAALATTVGLGAQLLTRSPETAVIVSPDPFVFMEMQLVDEYPPVEAKIGIRVEPTGTIVAVRCLYHGQGQSLWPIWLVVYPRDHDEEAIGSWVAAPGAEVSVTAVTHYSPAQIDRIELQSDGHTTIAWWRPSSR